MDKTQINIVGMTCNHCKAAVARAIQGVSGVQSVDVDLPEGIATVVGKPDWKKIIHAIEDEGYDATLVSPVSH
jgi:copper chaperone